MTKQFGKNTLLAALTLLLICGLASHRAYAADDKDKDSIQPVQSLTVFDVNGKKVGGVLDATVTIATVAFRVNGELVILDLTHDHFGGTSQGPSLLFESTNCMGTAFVISGPPGPSLAPLHILSGTLLYDYTATSTTITAKSQLDGSNCQAISPYQPPPVLPLRLLIDLSTQFTPPFIMK